MIILPDGAKVEMTWKSVKYINGSNFIVFQIVPMFEGSDIIIIPNIKRWENIEKIFSLAERAEIIFLLERIDWKRNVQIIELDIPAQVNEETKIINGSLESTKGYITLTDENLFDVDSTVEKEQVKTIYLALEKRYVDGLSGTVSISTDLLIKGSVMSEFIMPALKENKNIAVHMV